MEVIGLDIANAEAVFKAGRETEVEIVTDAKQPYPFALSLHLHDAHAGERREVRGADRHEARQGRGQPRARRCRWR